MHELLESRVGDRVELASCNRCAAGTVIDRNRGRLVVTFDDMPGTRWLLRADSLRVVAQHEARG